MLNWEMLHPRATIDMLGYIPDWVHENDSRSATAQLGNAYSFAGGWRPFKGFELLADDSLAYPGDPPTIPLAKAKLRDETIVFYQHSWVAVIQPDRSFEVCRMD